MDCSSINFRAAARFKTRQCQHHKWHSSVCNVLYALVVLVFRGAGGAAFLSHHCAICPTVYTRWSLKPFYRLTRRLIVCVRYITAVIITAARLLQVDRPGTPPDDDSSCHCGSVVVVLCTSPLPAHSGVVPAILLSLRKLYIPCISQL